MGDTTDWHARPTDAVLATLGSGPAAGLVHLAPLGPAGLLAVAGSVAAAVLTAVAMRRLLRLPQRL